MKLSFEVKWSYVATFVVLRFYIPMADVLELYYFKFSEFFVYCILLASIGNNKKFVQYIFQVSAKKP